MFIPLAVSASKIILPTVQAGKNRNRIFCYCFLLPTVFMYLHVALLSVQVLPLCLLLFFLIFLFYFVNNIISVSVLTLLPIIIFPMLISFTLAQWVCFLFIVLSFPSLSLCASVHTPCKKCAGFLDKCSVFTYIYIYICMCVLVLCIYCVYISALILINHNTEIKKEQKKIPVRVTGV